MDKKLFNVSGEWDYDLSNDILFFKIKNREYSHSIELKNLVIDIDRDNYIVGLQIFNASKFFNVDKIVLNGTKDWKLEINTEQNTAEIRLVFNVLYRNKLIEKNPILIQPFNKEMPDSRIICTA